MPCFCPVLLAGQSWARHLQATFALTLAAGPGCKRGLIIAWQGRWQQAWQGASPPHSFLVACLPQPVSCRAQKLGQRPAQAAPPPPPGSTCPQRNHPLGAEVKGWSLKKMRGLGALTTMPRPCPSGAQWPAWASVRHLFIATSLAESGLHCQASSQPAASAATLKSLVPWPSVHVMQAWLRCG